MAIEAARARAALFLTVPFLSGGGALAPLLASSSLAQSPPSRQVVAPASDVLSGTVRLPDPAASATVSCAAILPLRFERTDGTVWFAEATFPVEREGELALALLSPCAASWKVFARPPGSRDARPIDETFTLERRLGFASDLLPGWVIDRRDLRAAPAGTWTVRIEAEASAATGVGWLLASATPEVRAEAFVTTHRLVAGETIGVAVRAGGGEFGTLERVQVVLEDGGGARVLRAHDDGFHEDGAAGDGLYGAIVPRELSGPLLARAELYGTTRAGLPFLRGVQLAFTVLEPQIALDGGADARPAGEGKLAIELGAVPLGSARRFHVSAEVWGRGADGSELPACWLSRMVALSESVETDPGAARWRLPLELDLRWLGAAGAPLELRAVRVQDPDTEVVLDFAQRIGLATPAGAGGWSGLSGPPVPIEPVAYVPALMLVHGYCSGGSIWPPADFRQPVLEFLDPQQNRTHDQFAQLIAQRALSAGLSSFGVVAHSQGGPAALHLLTYYPSGLDLARGGRRIQSLASPYQGTPLASLGFFACGVNNNLTPSGAALWLAGIPNWARAEVSTFTTADSGAACNFFTNLLLVDPEDGTVEKFRAALPGAHDLGHTLGWCHTTGMSQPASYTDHARNQAMDAAAAR